MEEVKKDEDDYVVDKDLSKIKELSDDQLVAACGGMTAHKGGRHGLNMKAKLDRIAEAEREFLEKYGGGFTSSAAVENDEPVKKKKRKHEDALENIVSDICADTDIVVKKKKRKKDKNDQEVRIAEETIKVKEKKKKHKKSKHPDN